MTSKTNNQLSIKPKFNGSTIKFGKLPLFTKSLTALSNMDDVAQFVVEGRYYAVEIKGKDAKATSTADEAVESLLKALAKKDGFVSARIEEKPVQKAQPKKAQPKKEQSKKTLGDLGFVDLQSAGSDKPKKALPRVPVKGDPVKRGNLSLFDWLKAQDYVVEKLFVSETGEPLMNKIVDNTDVRLAFMEAGVEDNRKGSSEGGLNAARLSNVAVALLIRNGVLDSGFDAEHGGRRIYQLSIDKGGNYARKVHQTVSQGEYPINPKTGRRDVMAG